MTENWKSFKDTWEISNLGHVRNKNTKKLLKIRRRKDGYLDVKLSYKRFLVHRLVATLFILNPGNKSQVNHINAKKDDPRESNLEWVNQNENMIHATKLKLFPNKFGEKNPNCNITSSTAKEIKDLLSRGYSNAFISRQLNVTYHTVTNIKYKKSWID